MTFYRSNKPLEHKMADAFAKMAAKAGIEFRKIVTSDYDGPLEDTDIAVVMGVKGISKTCIAEHRMLGKTVIYIDKGYTRIKSEDPALSVKYWRISINAAQPLEYFQKIKRPKDRWKKTGFKVFPRQEKTGNRIIFAGSSQKYCTFNRLGDATQYAKTVIKRASKSIKDNDFEYIYRPKPSWKEAVEIEGSTFSQSRCGIDVELRKAHVLITHGSNAAMDAIRYGVPTLVLGDAIVKPIAMTEYSQLRKPTFPTDEERFQLFYDLAYCQWTVEEFESGEAWETIEEQIKWAT